MTPRDAAWTGDPATWGEQLARRIRAVDPAAAARHGVVATPPELATRLVQAALHPGAAPGQILDPAAGGGALLVAAARRIWADAGATTPHARAALVRAHLAGRDRDAEAVRTCRLALARAAGCDVAEVADAVQVADALTDPLPPADLVLANPPWVDATTVPPATRRAVAGWSTLAHGAWDLWVPVVERCLACLRPGGVLALLLPEAAAAAPYAAATRAVLHGARVVTVLEAVGPLHDDVAVRGLLVVSAETGTPPRPLPTQGAPWPLEAGPALDPTGAWPTLGTLAELVGAATVAEAYAWRDALTSGTPGPDQLPVVNTGTLDPWRTLWATRPLRYLGRRVERPVLPAAALGPRRLAQARRPKLVVGGLTRQLEVFPDLDGGWVAAKSTVLVLPREPASLPWLAAWLSSPQASAWYRHHYGALALRGGFLRVAPKLLAGLPVPPAPGDVTALVRARLARPDDPEAQARLDARVSAALGSP